MGLLALTGAFDFSKLVWLMRAQSCRVTAISSQLAELVQMFPRSCRATWGNPATPPAIDLNQAWTPWLYENLPSMDEQGKAQAVCYAYMHFALLGAGDTCFGLLAPYVLQFAVGRAFIASGSMVMIFLNKFALGECILPSRATYSSRARRRLAAVSAVARMVNGAATVMPIRQFEPTGGYMSAGPSGMPHAVGSCVPIQGSSPAAPKRGDVALGVCAPIPWRISGPAIYDGNDSNGSEGRIHGQMGKTLMGTSVTGRPGTSKVSPSFCGKSDLSRSNNSTLVRVAIQI